MRKAIIFIIVLIIQIGIIYGLYKWYVSETKPVTDTQTLDKDTQPAIPPPAQPPNETLPSKSVEKPKASTETPIRKTVQKNINPKLDIVEGISKPLIFKHADWGDIKELSESQLAATGILVDIDNRTVLWAKHCRKSVPIASMTKMMTALLAFEIVKSNPKISMDTKIKVTKEAYNIGGSQVWLDPRETFTLKQLLKTIMIKSANDSAYLVAQFLGNGDVNNFVQLMNKRAKEIGMANTHFSNPEGLPEKYSSEDNRATAEDMVFLAEHLLQYPQASKWATTKLAWFREGSDKPTMLTNTNYLVKSNFEGITGMKTGYIRRSGFCLTATCNREGKKLVAVVTGFKSRKARDSFVKDLLNWGYKRLSTIKSIQ